MSERGDRVTHEVTDGVLAGFPVGQEGESGKRGLDSPSSSSSAPAVTTEVFPEKPTAERVYPDIIAFIDANPHCYDCCVCDDEAVWMQCWPEPQDDPRCERCGRPMVEDLKYIYHESDHCPQILADYPVS
jgi:hypothetical protein